MNAAEDAFTEARQLFESHYNAEHVGALSARMDLAYVWMLKGELDRADHEFAQLLGPDSKLRADDNTQALLWWGETARRCGDTANAVSRTRRALENALKEGENNRHAAFAHYYLALALHDGHGTLGARSPVPVSAIRTVRMREANGTIDKILEKWGQKAQG